MKAAIFITLLMLATNASAFDKKIVPKGLESRPEVQALNCKFMAPFFYLSDGYKYIERPVIRGNFDDKTSILGGEVGCMAGIENLSGRLVAAEVNPLEKGDINGVPYTLFRYDQSGFLGEGGRFPDNWMFKCELNKVRNEKTCSITNSKSDEFVIFKYNTGKSKNGYWMVVGATHFPFSKATLVLNDDLSFESRKKNAFTEEHTLQLLNNVKNSDRISVSYHSWPANKIEHFEVDTSHIEEAIKVLDLLYDYY